ncbi:PLC-like protein, partial [Mya arenaria]
MGRRSATKKTGEEDVGDITICAECCSSPFCNIEGCGQPALPTSERGPYCFTCEKASSLDGCDNVTVCEKGDNCMMYIDASNLLQSGNDSHTGLCETDTLEEATKVSFSEAQAFCRQTGDELVTLDTYAKFNSVQYAIIHHSKEEQQQRNYWIGANANQTLSGKVFGWESLRTLGFTAWGPDEPDVDPSQLCVVLNVLENYEWFDTRCDSPFHFICEHDILRNGRFITGMQHPTASSKPLTTPSTPSTVSPSIHSSLTASLTTVF